MNTLVPSCEDVVRLLSSNWIIKGELQHTAFMLNPGETYLSVNRPAIESFCKDVAAFLSKHSDYCVGGKGKTYQCAVLNVGDINSISVCQDGTSMDISVEVEPRSTHTKSHAGIFTRFRNQNIKSGQTLKYGPMSEDVSADSILLNVRFQLLALSTVEQREINDEG